MMLPLSCSLQGMIGERGEGRGERGEGEGRGERGEGRGERGEGRGERGEGRGERGEGRGERGERETERWEITFFFFLFYFPFHVVLLFFSRCTYVDSVRRESADLNPNSSD